jgi:hypothetical protein
MPGVIGFVGCRGAKVRRVMRLIAGDAVRHTPCRSRCNLLIAFLGSTRFQTAQPLACRAGDGSYTGCILRRVIRCWRYEFLTSAAALQRHDLHTLPLPEGRPAHTLAEDESHPHPEADGVPNIEPGTALHAALPIEGALSLPERRFPPPWSVEEPRSQARGSRASAVHVRCSPKATVSH